MSRFNPIIEKFHMLTWGYNTCITMVKIEDDMVIVKWVNADDTDSYADERHIPIVEFYSDKNDTITQYMDVENNLYYLTQKLNHRIAREARCKELLSLLLKYNKGFDDDETKSIIDEVKRDVKITSAEVVKLSKQIEDITGRKF